jgi:integrase
MVPKRWSPTGKRRPHYFKTRELAAKFCQHVKTHGINYANEERPKGSAPVLSQRQLDQWQSAVQYCTTRLGGEISVLFSAVDHYLDTRHNVKTATIEEAIAAFHEARKHDPDVKSERTRQDDRSRLKTLSRYFEGQPVATITEAKLHEYFNSLRSNHRSIYKTVKLFFGSCRKYNYVAKDPMEDIDPVGEFGINNEYYEITEFRRMLRFAAGLDPIPGEPIPSEGISPRFLSLLPWMILSGFAGLRTCEVSRVHRGSDAIRWSDLHFDAKIAAIEVREAVAKGGRRRPIDKPYAIEAVKAWLDFYSTKSSLTDHICPIGSAALDTLKGEFTKATGIKFNKNGLRNSFATYALSYDGNEGAGSVAKQMGNSEKVLLSNYAQLLPSGSGQAWFDLRPETAVNVLPEGEIAA